MSIKSYDQEVSFNRSHIKYTIYMLILFKFNYIQNRENNYLDVFTTK